MNTRTRIILGAAIAAAAIAGAMGPLAARASASTGIRQTSGPCFEDEYRNGAYCIAYDGNGFGGLTTHQWTQRAWAHR